MVDKLKILKRIKELYANNQNIMAYLRDLDNNQKNTIEDITICYDFQAGSYSAYEKVHPEFRQGYCTRLAEVINRLGIFSSILEVGVGEASTLGSLYKSMSLASAMHWYGIDISWSRIKYAQDYLKFLRIVGTKLFVADLFSLPFKENSIDVVYTSHSLEPNSGREKEALQELYRVANQYIVLLEPAYELSSNEEIRERMRKHGYITGLYQSAKDLGYEVIEHSLFLTDHNPLNPTALMIIKKKAELKVNKPLCCPITHGRLKKYGNVYYSPDSFLAYPVIRSIPCLSPQHAVVAAKFLE